MTGTVLAHDGATYLAVGTVFGLLALTGLVFTLLDLARWFKTRTDVQAGDRPDTRPQPQMGLPVAGLALGHQDTAGTWDLVWLGFPAFLLAAYGLYRILQIGRQKLVELRT